MDLTTDLTKDEERMLVSYASGPRIWDATSLMPVVWRLRNLGLIELVEPNGHQYRHQLTDAGREKVEAMQRGARHWSDCKPDCTTEHPQAAPAGPPRAGDS